MANANAIVDKMAQVGLRHGEKAGVAIAVGVFLACVGMALSRETINTTPEQVKKAAQQSDQNLNRSEDRDTIVKRLEDTDNIKPTNFAAAVEEQIKIQLVADTYRPRRTWVSPEPGAGLIRDMPELIAPSELYANPGRGGLLVFDLDADGERIPVKEGDDVEKKEQRYGNTKRPKRGGMGGGMMGGMAGKRKKKRKSQAEIDREEKEERALKKSQLENALVGGTSKDEAKEKEEDKDEGGPYKQITKGYRWVAITGILDHGKMLENYRAALKNPATAHPEYIRLDLQRRTQQPDGTWSEWKLVDAGKSYDILDNVPAFEEELAPESVRPEGLVERLPFLNAGLWEKVHIASLVPKEKRELPEEPKNQGMGMMGRMGGGGSSNMMMNMMRNQGKMGNTGETGSGGMMPGMMPGAMGGRMGGPMGMGGAMGMGGGESAGNYWRSDEKKVMIRALDFTVEENTAYRYRVRIVVANPNYSHDDISPEAVPFKNKKLLEGPWSKETDVVEMPPDVQPYAMMSLPANPQSDTKIQFQVIRFNPADGWTVPKRFDAGVGEVIGELAREAVPRSDGSGTKREEIDFNSHEIVLDVHGGGVQNLPTGLMGPSVERPALAALLRAEDGAMLLHSQADDVSNEFRRDTYATYRHELSESDKNKKRKNSQGSGSMMMGGGMMPGGGRGGRR